MSTPMARLPDAVPDHGPVLAALTALIRASGDRDAGATLVPELLAATAKWLGAEAATLLRRDPRADSDRDGAWRACAASRPSPKRLPDWSGEAAAAVLEAALAARPADAAGAGAVVLGRPKDAPLPPAAAGLLAARGCAAVLVVPVAPERTAGGAEDGTSAAVRAALVCEFASATVADPADPALLLLVAEALALRRPPDRAPALSAVRLADRETPQPPVEGPPELTLRIDAAGRFCDVETDHPDLMPAPAEAILGRTPEEVLPPELQSLCRQALAGVDAAGRSGPFHYRWDLPSGRRRFALNASRPADDAAGYLLQVHDMTSRFRLLHDAAGMRHVIERMTDLVIVTDPDRRIEWVNPAFEARTGWRLSEVLGRRAGDVLNAPETDRKALEQLQASPLQGAVSGIEILNRARDGTRFWTRVNVQTLYDEDGGTLGYVTIETDITDRKRQDAELARLAREATEARARLEMAVEALPDGFAYYDADERLVLCNTPYRELYPGLADKMVPGVSLEEVLRHGIANGSFPAAEGREEGFVQDRLASHRAGATTHETQLKGGRWLRVIERPTPDGGRAGMRVDITEIKRAEQRLAAIIEGAEVGTWEWTVTTGENLINARWAEMLGYRLDELLPMRIDLWRSLCHPEDLARAEALLAGVFDRRLERFEYELRMRHKAGHWVWVQSRGRVVRWAGDGSPEAMAGVHLDITALKEAETRLEAVIRGAEAGTWQIDMRSGVQQINDRWADMLGYSRAELEPMTVGTFTDLLHPDDRREGRHLGLEDSDRVNERFEREFRMRHRDGHWIWVLSRGQVVIRDSEGRAAVTAGIHLDVTDRKRLAAELEAERDMLAQLMATSVSGIVALDAGGHIVFANREAEALLGVAPGRLIGLHVEEREWRVSDLNGKPLPESEMPFSRVLATGAAVRDFRHSVAAPDGTQRQLSINAAPVSAGQGAARVVCIMTDITAQVAAEAKLQAALARAEQANRAKSLFLANMSHEIRTPLNGVLGMAEVLGDALTDPAHRRMIDTIRDSGEMLLSVLNDVLDMTKIEAGRLELERVTFRPEDLAQRLEAIHCPAAREKGLALMVESAAGIDRPRIGDPHRILQILHNLVGNAVKFTDRGGVKVRLEAAPDESLRIEVTDTGIGMSEEQVARIFDEFVQADDTVTRRYGGTGLGLAIVRRLLELMGGRIRVDSLPGRGTRVRVSLPLPAAPQDRPAGSADAAGAGAAAAANPLAGLRVLAADDVATNRLILKAMLGSLGVLVEMVGNGREAVDRAAETDFDVLLLDISMPELDGISALARIRDAAQQLGRPVPPAVAITANALSHQVTEYLDAGFAAHIGKPFRREDLDRTLRGLDLATP